MIGEISSGILELEASRESGIDIMSESKEVSGQIVVELGELEGLRGVLAREP